MTPQERQLVDDLFERLARLEAAPRDPDAAAAITQGLRLAPNAIYGLVQTVLVQDEALKRAHERIQELEAGPAQAPARGGGFLDSMRDAIFGQDTPQQRGSVPNVPPPGGGGTRPAWNTGQVLGQPSGAPPYSQPPQAPYSQPQGQYGGSFGGQGASPLGGSGGSFLGTAAAAAAGVVGGSLLLSSIRGMMGGGSGSQQSLADPSAGGGQSPWGGSDASGGNLAQQAGLGDIGSQRGGVDDSSRYGMTDQANNDYDRVADRGYEQDDMGFDGDDFGGGDSDFA